MMLNVGNARKLRENQYVFLAFLLICFIPSYLPRLNYLQNFGHDGDGLCRPRTRVDRLPARFCGDGGRFLVARPLALVPRIF